MVNTAHDIRQEIKAIFHILGFLIKLTLTTRALLQILNEDSWDDLFNLFLKSGIFYSFGQQSRAFVGKQEARIPALTLWIIDLADL